MFLGKSGMMLGSLLCTLLHFSSIWSPAMPAPTRSRIRFSLRTLAFAVTAVSLWLGIGTYYASTQMAVVKQIEELGGDVFYEHQIAERSPYTVLNPDAKTPGPAWLRSLIGENYFVALAGVQFFRDATTKATDEDIDAITKVSTYVSFRPYGSNMTDEGVAYLRRLPKLAALGLDGTKVTDRGLGEIGRISTLRELYLNGLQITDAGLKHLSKLPLLYELALSETAVSDAGLSHLANLPQLARLELGSTSIDGSGLGSLSRLPELEYLGLSGTQVGDDDIPAIVVLKHLKRINVYQTKFTENGVEELKRQYPNLEIESEFNW